jgi:DNA-binding NarL/FixJ family response regulator
MQQEVVTTSERAPRRVMILDGDEDVRSALRLLLTHQPEFLVIGESDEPEVVLTEAAATQPDIIVLDWDLRALHRGDQLANLRRACPEARIVALSTRDEERQAALAAGLAAWVCKSEAPAQLLAALRGSVP